MDDNEYEVEILTEYILNIEVAKSGNETLKINEYHVHSKYNPIIESERIAEKEYSMNCTHIVFGYGKGYVVDSLLRKMKNESIIIVDPLIAMGKIQIEERHKNCEKIYYWEEKSINTLGYLISTISEGKALKIKVIVTPNYDKLFVKNYRDLLIYLRDFQNKTQINYNTEVFFANQWQRNFSINVPMIAKDESLSVLHNQFDLPIVLAAGGPSLTKQLPLLKKIQEHVIIIASGSTVNSLLAADLEPDFVISIDGGEPNYKHFKDLQFDKARLIYSPYNHYGVRKSFRKRGYVFTQVSQEEVGKYLLDNIGINLPVLAGGGTVAHYGVTVAGLFNSGPIAMIGQDLAYTNNQTHAKGNKFAKEVEELSELNVELIPVEGYDGETVYTSRDFLSMKMVFEEIIRFYKPLVPIYNCTEGGVKLKGYEQMSFKDFVDTYVETTKVKNLDYIDNHDVNYKTDKEIVDIYKKELKLIGDLENLLIKGMNVLHKVKNNTFFDQHTLNLFDKIEKEINQKSKKIQIHFLIGPITLEVSNCYLEKPNETQKEAFERVWNQTYTLYKRLLEAFKKVKINLRDVITEIED
ncbi:motility associated factor glycosyltransferase family protein [Ureibacillus sp. Re31]|uniref:Motility associated factor glycosyltransferase family protein n=1 Tax=Ureibacillus galli TaxID=2762222 RepID=A0ABR8X877_9BACL|nr:motility associated factor glycosyltransferase family protein [Ureibacillus galli]